jgi:hypothetical protein
MYEVKTIYYYILAHSYAIIQQLFILNTGYDKMSKRTFIFFMTGFFIIFNAPSVLAEKVLPNVAVPISVVINQIEKKGYQDIRSVEFEDGIYKAEATNREGKEVKIYIDPLTNKILSVKIGWKIKRKINTVHFSVLDILKKVEEAGYQNIYEVELDGNQYEIKAFDRSGRKSKLKVDINTGKIQPRWFD